MNNAYSEFASAHAAWLALDTRQGPAASYKAAQQLPDLARSAGPEARALARRAVGACLFWMGRAREALSWLEGQDAPETLWAHAVLGEWQADAAQPWPPLTCFFLDQASACLAGLATADSPFQVVLRHWALVRSDLPVAEPPVQAALARLRREAPCDEARGLAIHATAAFRQHPVHALPHLDQALAQCARFGLHFLDVQLYDMKARALDAAGLLRDADRFRRAAADALQRQQGAAHNPTNPVN